MSGVTPGWLAVAVSVIAAFGVLVAATVTAYAAAAVRERAARRTEHESARLAELLEAAIELRALLNRLSLTPDADEAITAYERAFARFLALRHAVLASRVRRLAVEWEQQAVAGRFADEPTDTRRERPVWETFVAEIGVARRRVL